MEREGGIVEDAGVGLVSALPAEDNVLAKEGVLGRDKIAVFGLAVPVGAVEERVDDEGFMEDI